MGTTYFFIVIKDGSKESTYTFKIKGTAYGNNSILTDTINFYVYDCNLDKIQQISNPTGNIINIKLGESRSLKISNYFKNSKTDYCYFQSYKITKVVDPAGRA